MIVAQWSCEVPNDQFNDFKMWAKETLKPYYESHGCQEYSVFLPLEKKYFSYQVTQAKTRYTEQFKFKDLEEYERFLRDHEEDSEAREVTSAYRGRFKAHSCTIVLLEQIM